MGGTLIGGTLIGSTLIGTSLIRRHLDRATYQGELIDTGAELSTDGKIAFSAITGTTFLGGGHLHGWVAL